MVMGAYGHMRARELVFGGCTQDMLANADVPTLFMN
jgi:nucleotide-binding universal stress UspA family protein